MDKESKIDYAKFLIEEITTKFLQKDKPYIIMKDFEYIRDVITLYAKQSNLFESALLLLENNHAEEAYIIVRSMLNNAMLIDYLCNDIDGSRYKNYMIQPTKAHLSFLKDVRQAYQKGWLKEKPPRLDENIEHYQNQLIEEDYTFVKKRKRNKPSIIVADTKLLNIKEMALTDDILFAQYFMFYRDGSKYEHSDISSLEIYKEEIEGYPNSSVFILNLSRTDVVLDEKVLNLAIQIYSMTFMKLLKHINDNHEQLIDEAKRKELAVVLLNINPTQFKFV